MKKYLFAACLLTLAAPASAQSVRSDHGRITGIISHDATLDYNRAEAMPLPMSKHRPLSQLEGLMRGANAMKRRGRPGSIPGRAGSGEQAPLETIGPGRDAGAVETDSDVVGPFDMGSSNHPFTTARVNAKGDAVSQHYPFTPTGKLFFKINGNTFVCSASLIQRGVIVTAAHCVANYGTSQFYSNWRFVPAYQGRTTAYGSFRSRIAWVPTSYLNGTDGCTVPGVVCPNNVAVIVLKPTKRLGYPGNNTGYYGVGWNGYGFNPGGQILINQLGYPVALDKGRFMLRDDSQGFVDPGSSNNTVIGSMLTGGSSGGPWLVNLGVAPKLGCNSDGCTVNGAAPQRNTVVGVTSWGYTAMGGIYQVMQQGASPFTSANICPLINAACFDGTNGTPAACNIKVPLNC